MSLDALRREIGAVNDLLCAASVLTWDSRTMMPPGGVETRGRQIATLMDAARERLLASATRRALDGAEAATQHLPADSAERRETAAVREAIAFHERIPADLIRAKAELRSRANAAWSEARRLSDFSIFAPHLAGTVDLQRTYAQAIGYADHPYDALLALYEPGETTKSVRALFEVLRPALREVRAAASAKPEPRLDFMRRAFPAEAQRRFGEAVAARFGYDLNRGRLDFTVHPFEVSFTRHDVRITMRRAETFEPPAIFGAMHEVGHGLYEQNVNEAYTRNALATDLKGLYGVGGTSFGAHESQSRLYENHVGRSRAFWEREFPALREAFAPSLDDVDADAFLAAVTRVSSGFIRTDADELTYDLHIMLRVEIEADLIAGRLAVADIPEAWNAAMERDLGLTPPDDARGCLQDIHWSSGMFGSFCTYTIGNVMAAQLFAVASTEAPVAAGLEAGDYAPLGAWLRERVWRHGRRFTRDEILERATGRALEVGPYLDHLRRRYA
jgi:carboxypeptidase Taq